MIPEGYTTWIQIDMAALRQNISHLVEITNTPVMAVIKANAYGHGLVQVGRESLAAGASWLGVARFEEARQLRQAGISEPVLVLGYTHPANAVEAAREGIRLCLFDSTDAQVYAACAQSAGLDVKVHAKIDSGMGRLGVSPENGLDFVLYLQKIPGILVEGIFTHFARSDEPEAAGTTLAQLNAFSRVVAALDEIHLCPPVVHASNSAAALTLPEARFNLVRSGIAIYGLDPSPECPLPPGFQPVLSWKAILASAKSLPAGHGVGYGHWHVTAGEEFIGVIPVGYSDGFRRVVENEVLIHGELIQVFPRVCMDQALLSLQKLPDARPGDEIVLIGKQGARRIRVEDIARRWKTNNYDVVSGLAARIPRMYVNSL